VFNGIIVSPDGNSLFINSGSRTDHGEVEDDGGVFPNTREVALTAKIFRLPATASNLLLPNDTNALRNAGYIFAEGTRNSFDFAWAPNGDLFATENGPDRDMSDELNWLRQGLHESVAWTEQEARRVVAVRMEELHEQERRHARGDSAPEHEGKRGDQQKEPTKTQHRYQA